MKKAITVIGLLTLLAPYAASQEQILSSNALYWIAKNNNTTIHNPPPMASISRDGDVTIDWPEVERTAADPNADPGGNKAYARLMIAIRDGTWKAPSR